MKICVCVKQVPDSYADKRLSASDFRLERGAADRVINEPDEFAVEAALQLVEAHGGEVTVLSMGPEEAMDSVRKAISMGANDGILITDPALAGSDALATSAALAKAIDGRGFDMVILGVETTDARMGVLPAMLAQRLGWPLMGQSTTLVVDGSTVKAKRRSDDELVDTEASLPAVVAVVEKINEPRFPNFKGIMAAKKAPVETLSLADLGLSADSVGAAGASVTVTNAQQRPPKAKGQVITDDGTAAAQIVDFLAAAKLI